MPVQETSPEAVSPGQVMPAQRADRRVLQLDAASLALIRRHAEEDYPRECCGILAGRLLPDGVRRVAWVRRATNIVEGHRAHREYEIDPRDLLRADKDARAQGLDVLGYYHSHPDGRAEPSALDAERAWPSYSYVIVAVRDGEAREVRSWVFDEAQGRFFEEPVVVSPAPAQQGPAGDAGSRGGADALQARQP